MFAIALTCAAVLADPVLQVQVRFPAARTTITTASGATVTYSLATDAPPELRRAYKMLEIAEREVFLTEALQLFEAELLANARRLETLRTARTVAYLTDLRTPRRHAFIDPGLIGSPELSLKAELSRLLAADGGKTAADRALAALDRLDVAHAHLRKTMTAVVYPNRVPFPAVPEQLAPGRPPARPAVPPVPVPATVAAAERAERLAARAEAAAEKFERETREKERMAEVRYRESTPEGREARRVDWVEAWRAWDGARRQWEAARDRWKVARDNLRAVEAATRPAAAPAAPR